MPDADDFIPLSEREFARALSALPTPPAPADGWQRLQGTLAARRRRTGLRLAVPLAAAALLALALAPSWQRQAAPPAQPAIATVTADPAAGHGALDDAIAANQALEAALRGAARPALLDGQAALVGAEIEDLIGMLDLELSDTRDDARATALWRERAMLLEQLAGVRTGAGVEYADTRGSPGLVPASYPIN